MEGKYQNFLNQNFSKSCKNCGGNAFTANTNMFFVPTLGENNAVNIGTGLGLIGITCNRCGQVQLFNTKQIDNILGQ